MAGGLGCCLIKIQQAAEMSHSLKGSFSHPQDPPIISIILKRKHFQWNSAIKKLCSHVNCFLYLAKQKNAGFPFFWLVCSPKTLMKQKQKHITAAPNSLKMFDTNTYCLVFSISENNTHVMLCLCVSQLIRKGL